MESYCNMELTRRKKRFSELKRTLVTINDKMLSQVLRELEEQGVVNRKVYEVVPPKVEYSLTDEGKNCCQLCNP